MTLFDLVEEVQEKTHLGEADQMIAKLEPQLDQD
jgi:hypothetical protein